jgi:hypothetical protein
VLGTTFSLRISTIVTCKYAEHSGATSNVKDYFILKKLRIVHDSMHVSFGSDCVLKHFFVDGEVRVAVKIVVGILNISDIGFFLSDFSLLMDSLVLFWFHALNLVDESDISR